MSAGPFPWGRIPHGPRGRPVPSTPSVNPALRREKHCPICGESFIGYPNATYCSNRCGREARAIEVACEGCGQLFKRDPSSEQRFCSRTCAANGRANGAPA